MSRLRAIVVSLFLVGIVGVYSHRQSPPQSGKISDVELASGDLTSDRETAQDVSQGPPLSRVRRISLDSWQEAERKRAQDEAKRRAEAEAKRRAEERWEKERRERVNAAIQRQGHERSIRNKAAFESRLSAAREADRKGRK